MARPNPLYRALASLVIARQNCRTSNNDEWFDRHTERAEALVKERLPSGGGFDSGTTIDWNACRENRLVFATSFHHMDDVGYYDGWTKHTVTVSPSLLSGFDLKIGGRNKRDIKDYIHEAFDVALRTEVE